MKALSVKQPFASLIAEGTKTIEIRTKKTNYRGKVLICSSKTIHKTWELLMPDAGAYEVAKEVLMFTKKESLGSALCIAELYACHPMELIDEVNSYCEYSEGVYSWKLRNIQKIEPFKVKGQLGLFNATGILGERFIEICNEMLKDKNLTESQAKDFKLFYDLFQNDVELQKVYKGRILHSATILKRNNLIINEL